MNPPGRAPGAADPDAPVPPNAPSRPIVASAWGRGARTLSTVAMAALGWYACLLAVHAWRLVRFPYQANYGEGAILNQAHRLLAGLSLYHNDRSPPYIVANYPPIYPAAVALLEKLGFGAGFAGGRMLSACAVVAAALLAGLAVRATLTGGAGPTGRAAVPGTADAGAVAPWAAAAFTAGLMLAQSYIWHWGALERVDSLALAWQMAGLYAVARRPAAAGRAWPWFLLAALTRQSSVEGLAAAVWYLWRREPGAARPLLLRWALALALTVAALTAATRGQFLVHVVLDNVNRWSLPQFSVLASMWVFVGGGLPLLALAAVGWRAGRGIPEAALWRGFAVCALAAALTAGKVGSAINYFFPSIAAASALAGIGAAALRRRTVGAALLCLYAVGIPPLADAATTVGSVVRALTAYRDLGTPTYASLTPAVTANGQDPAQARLVALLRRTPGPVLSENMGALVLAGHAVYLQPFVVTQLDAEGRWSDAPVVALAERRAFTLVVLQFPLEQPARWDTQRWAPNLLRALSAGYVRDAHIGRYYVYRPGS